MLEHANSSSSNLSSRPLILSIRAGSLSLDLSDVEGNQLGITLLARWVSKNERFTLLGFMSKMEEVSAS